jgi:hypothetical protein
MKKWMVNGFHGVNLAAFGAQFLGAVPQKPWVMFAQMMLSALAPSLGGVGHKVVFGGEQDKK